MRSSSSESHAVRLSQHVCLFTPHCCIIFADTRTWSDPSINFNCFFSNKLCTNIESKKGKWPSSDILVFQILTSTKLLNFRSRCIYLFLFVNSASYLLAAANKLYLEPNHRIGYKCSHFLVAGKDNSATITKNTKIYL